MNPRPQLATKSFTPELIARILELAVEDLADEWTNPTRVSLLCQASLVDRNWRTEAQTLLWRRVELKTEARTLLLLSSSALGRYRTRQLSLMGPQLLDLTVPSAMEMAAHLIGIEELDLAYFALTDDDQLDSSFLSLPNLKGMSPELL